MSNISIYLNREQQKQLDTLTKKGLAEELTDRLNKVQSERSRSALVAILIEKEYKKLLEAEMIADAVIIDRNNLGWNQEEERCQTIDLEQSGQ